MPQINAYLNFNGNCREAMTFYKEALGGELVLQTVEGSPLESQCPSAMKHYILHSTLTREDMILMASDMAAPEGFIKGNTIALSLNCSSEDEINTYFSNLSTGGKILHPLAKQFWGATFGVLNDKYGIRWMFNYDKR
jgi:PhnB protein